MVKINQIYFIKLLMQEVAGLNFEKLFYIFFHEKRMCQLIKIDLKKKPRKDKFKCKLFLKKNYFSYSSCSIQLFDHLN